MENNSSENILIEVVTEFSHYLPGEQVNGIILVQTSGKNESSEIMLKFWGKENIEF